MRLKEIGLHAQNMLSILDSTTNMIEEYPLGGGSPLWPLNEHISTLITKKIFIRASILFEANDYEHDFNVLIVSH